MEWVFKQMIQSPAESYSPEQVKQMLDAHQVAIERLLIFLFIICLICIADTIVTEIRIYKINKRFKNILDQNEGRPIE